MACKVLVEDGYDVEVIEDHPQQLICAICTLFIREATHGCKSHAFCKCCIEKHVEYGIRNEGKVICPGGCRQEINPKDLQANNYVDRMINTLTTKCSNEQCKWKGDLLDLVQVHQMNCGYLEEVCPNILCKKVYFKQDAMQHENECFYRLVQCEYCQNDVIKIEKEQHEDVCSMEMIECEYYSIGCKQKFCRKDYHLHETNNQGRHMKLIYHNFTTKLLTCSNELLNCKDELLSCKDQLSKSREEVSLLQQNNSVLNNKVKTLEIDYRRVSLLDEQMKKMKKEFAEMKQGNNQNVTSKSAYKAKEKLKVEKPPIKPRKSKKKMETLKRLKEELAQMTSETKVHLIHNESMLYARCYGQYVFDMRQLSMCYHQNNIDYVAKQLNLQYQTKLLEELIHEMEYQLYEVENEYYHNFYFCFLFNDEIQDFNISIPLFQFQIVDREMIVTVDSATDINVYMKNQVIVLENGVKIHLDRDLDRSVANSKLIFASGYGCLCWSVVKKDPL